MLFAAINVSGITHSTVQTYLLTVPYGVLLHTDQSADYRIL
jgi:hypothetical protein